MRQSLNFVSCKSLMALLVGQCVLFSTSQLYKDYYFWYRTLPQNKKYITDLKSILSKYFGWKTKKLVLN